MRPKSTEPIRTKLVQARVTEAEYQVLERIIQREGGNQSAVMRRLLQEGARNRGMTASVPGLESSR